MKINERNFLKCLKLRNEKALHYVIDEYGGLLQSILKKHLYSFPDKQEECLDDVLLAIWENIDKYEETRSTFKNWICGIARYKAMDYLRKYLKDQELLSLDNALEVADSNLVTDNTLNQELSEELELMLNCLNFKDRELFLKLFYEEKTLDEISLETGVKKEVLYNRISRGKKRIRKHYQNLKGVSL